MRLAGQKLMGYFRTPDRVVDIIRERVQFPEKHFAVLDPCCGEALALERFARDTGAVTYGIELDDVRAATSKERLHHVLHSGIEETSVAHKAFSAIWLNPPYDWEAREDDDQKCERKELTFLKRALPWLAPGGVLIYIIPESVWNDKLGRLLAFKLDQAEAWRFPEPEYEDFKQVVVMGTRKEADDVGQPLLLSDYSECGMDTRFILPPTNSHVKVFRSSRVDRAEVERLILNSPVWRTFEEQTKGKSVALREKRPPLSLKAGHKALLLASGLMDGVVGSNGDSHVIKGRVVKGVRATSEMKVSEDGKQSWTVTKELDEYHVSIKVLDKLGNIRELV